MKKRRLVLIEWVDALGCSPIWETIADPLAPTLATCRSVGWLAHDGEDIKVVVPHIHDGAEGLDNGCGDMAIPARSVTRIVDLEERHD